MKYLTILAILLPSITLASYQPVAKHPSAVPPVPVLVPTIITTAPIGTVFTLPTPQPVSENIGGTSGGTRILSREEMCAKGYFTETSCDDLSPLFEALKNLTKQLEIFLATIKS